MTCLETTASQLIAFPRLINTEAAFQVTMISDVLQQKNIISGLIPGFLGNNKHVPIVDFERGNYTHIPTAS